LDSLDTVEVTMAIEEEFNIELTDEEAESITSVGAAVEKIASKWVCFEKTNDWIGAIVDSRDKKSAVRAAKKLELLRRHRGWTQVSPETVQLPKLGFIRANFADISR
jgi:hypothetical protein